MFKKLVSSLPSNPSLLSEVSFYAKRLHQEESIRRTGFALMALAILVQTFALISPPQSSLAGSANDTVYDSREIGTVTKAITDNRDGLGRTDIQTIFNHYGVTLSDVQNGTKTVINSKDADYITTGRTESPERVGENVPVNIAGLSTSLYERPLRNWDGREWSIANGNNYDAVTGIATGNGLLKGQRFWVLLGQHGSSGGCGNITFTEIPKNPNLEIKKKKATSGDLKPGDELNYNIYFRNTGNAAATSAKIVDSLPAELEYKSYSLGNGSIDPASTFNKSGQQITWGFDRIRPTAGFQYLIVRTVVKDIDANKRVCNSATLTASNHGSIKTSDPESERCADIKIPVCEDAEATNTGGELPCEYPPVVIVCEDNDATNTGGELPCEYPPEVIVCEDDNATNTGAELPCTYPPPRLTCENLGLDKIAFNRFKFTTEIAYIDAGAEIAAVEYYINNELVQTNETSVDALIDMYEHTFNADGDYTIRAVVVAKENSQVVGEAGCNVNLSVATPQKLEPIVTQEKAVAFTSSGTDANGQTAQAGDELTFTLTVSNQGDAAAPNEVFRDNIADILEYADLTDEGGAQYDGIAQALTWSPVDIAPGESISRTFKVRVKDPIPSTPVAASDPLSYDMVIDNKFGNWVSVELPTPFTKQVETSVATLPRTGPGTTMAVSSFVFIVVGYFFYRSRLMAKELDVIKAEQSAGGI